MAWKLGGRIAKIIYPSLRGALRQPMTRAKSGRGLPALQDAIARIRAGMPAGALGRAQPALILT
jgi:hypothetical protein